MEIGYLVVKILYAVVVYQAGTDIAGFSPNEILVFIGTFVLLTGFYSGLLMLNLYQLSTQVMDGSFDILLTKPISIQFFSTLRKSNFGIFLVDLIAGISLIVYGLLRANVSVSIFRIFGFCLFIISGSLVCYSIALIPQTIVFRIFETKSIMELTDSFWRFNNVPMVVYNRIIQFLGVFIIPIFVITGFPSLLILNKLDVLHIIWGVILPLLAMMISRFFWRSGLKHYSSAGG